MDTFLKQLVNGLSLGSIYALIALGYTMVYGIVKLINFAEELFNVEVKNMTDLQTEHEEGLAEGRELGFAEGKAEGYADGKTEGFAEGKAEGFAAGEKAERAKADKEKRDIAKGLREDGVPMDVIIRRTGFSKEEIESL